jgi:hypothetical protein
MEVLAQIQELTLDSSGNLSVTGDFSVSGSVSFGNQTVN